MKTKVEILDMITLIEKRNLELDRLVGQLQNDVRSLNEDIANVKDSAETCEEQKEYKYQFTQEQMTKLVNDLRQHFTDEICEQVSSESWDFADSCSIEWETNGNTAEAMIEVDNDDIADVVGRSIQSYTNCDLNDREVEMLVAPYTQDENN